MIITKDLQNSRDLKKLRDAKNECEYIGKKGHQFTMILKNHGNFKNRINFLTLKLSTV